MLTLVSEMAQPGEARHVEICVYCSSSSLVSERYRLAARELGQLIGARGHALVYGGCCVGVMGELARAVKAAGGRVVGVIPRGMEESGLAYDRADEMLVTESIAERKALMERRAGGFVALPGGFGTLDELAEVMALRQLGQIIGPIVLINLGGFYDDLLSHFDRVYRDGFAPPDLAPPYHVVTSPREALDHLERRGRARS